MVLKATMEMNYSDCFKEWKKRWHKCIVSAREYFEGNESDLEE